MDGRKLLGPDLLDEMLRIHAQGVDEVFGNTVAFGLGMRLDGGSFKSAEFGYGGIGGSMAIGNRKQRMSFAYVTRCLKGPERAAALERALLPFLGSAGN